MTTSTIVDLLSESRVAIRLRLPGDVATLAGALVHASMLLLFAALAIWPMAIFNVVSVLVFLGARALFARGRFHLAIATVSVEVLVHQVLAVLFCGWAPGFQYFLATIPLALMLPGPRVVGLATTAATSVVFVALAILAPATPPYPFPAPLVHVVAVANALGAFSVLWLFMFLYRVRADETDEALAAALARSDGLLRAIFPASIVERLRESPTRVAESYPAVTILFADIVGFTPLAERVPPEELVAILDELFADFDALVDARGLEKIKTIGDSYMVAAGVPEARRDHAVAIAELALAIREATADFAARRGIELSLRIGAHSGAVVAGVIGRSKLAYDLWGDTVNTAARMESHGEPGRIQISAATAALLEGRFQLEARGAIEVKGKGAMATSWLVARAASPADASTAINGRG
ncbi:MAG: adenylate/guanylate cyclase domain-containing protein [Myxococcales bacterium]|nr:adenylate/guanylate cyclase domain-containing protein [Myxococcales bacterium]